MTDSPAQVQSAQLAADLLSRELFKNKKQLRIEHQGEIYTLRITSKGKLILTK